MGAVEDRSLIANTGIVSSELYKANFGLNTVEVKYKDAGAMLNDLWGHNVAFAHLDPVTSMAHLKTGKLRALATSSKERFKALPDIPSAGESGITNSDIIAWWSVHMPKGTPKTVIAKFSAAAMEALADPAVRERLAALGQDIPPPELQTAEALGKHYKAEIAKWWPVIKAADIKVE